MTTDNNNSRLPVPTQGDTDTPRTTVITPEIVDDSAQGQQGGQQGQGGFYSQTSGSNGSRFTYTTWSGGAGMGPGMGGGLVARDGCFPVMITLLLTGVCAVQWGILSAISFVVFYMLASGMSFMLRLRNLMQGRNIDPWVFRIVSWVGAGILVAWLSDAF